MTQPFHIQALLKTLEGVPFPVLKLTLRGYCADRGVARMLMDQIEAMPDRLYYSLDDVKMALNVSDDGILDESDVLAIAWVSGYGKSDAIRY